MNKLAVILGVCGGITGIVIAVFSIAAGQILKNTLGTDATMFIIVSFLLPVTGLIGVFLLKRFPEIGSALMILSGWLSWSHMSFTLTFVTLLPAILLVLSGVIVILNKKTHREKGLDEN